MIPGDGIKVEIAFSTAPDASSPAWVDVTQYVMMSPGITIQRGRSPEGGRVSASTMTLTLKNDDGRFTAGEGWTTRENLSLNPRFAVDATWWGQNFGVGGAGTAALFASGGPNAAIPGFRRITWTTGTTAVGNNGQYHAVSGGIACQPGDLVSGSVWVRSSKAQLMTLYVQYLDAAAATLLSTNSTPVLVAANTWTQLTLNQSQAAPAGTTKVRALAYNIAGTGSVLWAVGDTLDVTGLLMERASSVGTYFDGTTAGSTLGDGFLRAYAWSGSPHLSSSLELRRSPYYPNLKLHRRVRVSWVNPIGGATFTRWVGFVNEWPVSWPGPNLARVSLSASDRMKRLGRLRKLRNAVQEAILADSPRAYFPLNEPTGATSAGDISLAHVSSALTIRQYGSGGEIAFGEGTGPATDSASAVVFRRASSSNGKSLIGSAPDGYNQSATVLSFELTFATTSTVQRLVEFASAEGESVFVEIDTSGNLALGTAVSGFLPGKVSSVGVYNDGATHHLLVTVTSGGSAVAKVDGATAVTFSTSASWATALPTFVNVELGGSSPVMANATISNFAIGTPGHSTALLTGFAGERSDQRIARILGWAGVVAGDLTLDVGSSTNIEAFDTTGLTALEAAQRVSDTEGGPLFIDRATGDVVLHARSRRFSAAVAMSVTADQCRPGVVTTIDDTDLANDITGRHGSGAAYHAVDQSSIDDHGYAEDSLDLVCASDSEVVDAVNWNLATRSQPKGKTPEIALDLLDDSIRVNALAVDISSLLRVTSLPSQAGTSRFDLFVEGYTETISDRAWELACNTSALQRSGDVWKLEDPDYGVLDAGHLIGY